MASTRRFYRAAAAVVLPGAALGLLAALPPTAAQAQTSGGPLLRITSPRGGDAVGSSSFALDVAFQSRSKSPVTTAELWVDGVRWVRRDLDTPQIMNVLSFAVDASSLSGGAHNFVVKVFCANGTSAQTNIQVDAGSSMGVLEGSLGGPDLTFRSLTNGKKVQGTVDLEVDAPSKNGVNPYVAFYIDKQFKTLKNYPPYSFSWDTTAVTNGYHVIETTGYSEVGGAQTTRRIQVFVDNPGGNTVLKRDIPDLRVSKNAKPAVKTVAKTIAPLVPTGSPVSSHTKAVSTKVAALDLAPALSSSVAASVADLRSAAPRVSTVNKTVKPVAVIATTVRGSVAASVMPAMEMREAALAPIATPIMGVQSATPRLMLPRVSAARVAAKPAVVANHSIRVAAPAARNTPLVPRAKSNAAPRVAVRPAALGMLNLPEGGTFQVAFNGQQIAFDVQPRVEAGLPIAPFRQIFEHTGGQVMWVPATRVVRAVNADREVILKMGNKKATVNGQSFTMDRAAFLEKGRAIVPLTFVGQALNVDVKYDAATGRLQITSK